MNVNGASAYNADAKSFTSEYNADVKSIGSSESSESEEDFYDTVKHGSNKKVRKKFLTICIK